MSQLNHSLYIDLPEHKDRIQQLKQENQHFAQIASQYHKLDHQVRGLETRNIPVTDQTFGELKQQRLSLKDELLKIIIEH